MPRRVVFVKYEYLPIYADCLRHAGRRERRSRFGSGRPDSVLHADLIAIDDIMLFPIKKEDSSAFFNLINTLHEKVSIIITTNKSPTEWAETLDDEVLASALLDRLIYKCEVIKLSGASYRMENRQTILKKETKRGRQRKNPDNE